MKRHPDEVEQMRRPSPAAQVAGLALFAPLEIPENTRRAAQEAITPRITRLEELVINALGQRPATADEIADRVGEDRLSIRPRCTALHQRGVIYDTGERRPNASGKNATVWALRRPG